MKLDRPPLMSSVFRVSSEMHEISPDNKVHIIRRMTITNSYNASLDEHVDVV